MGFKTMLRKDKELSTSEKQDIEKELESFSGKGVADPFYEVSMGKGRKKKQLFTKRITIYVDTDTYEKFNSFCEEEGLLATVAGRMAIKKFLKEL